MLSRLGRLLTHLALATLLATRFEPGAVSRRVPRHTSNANACMRDGRMINRYTIWPALLTPAASIDAAKPSKGPGARQEMGNAPMTVAASSRQARVIALYQANNHIV